MAPRTISKKDATRSSAKLKTENASKNLSQASVKKRKGPTGAKARRAQRKATGPPRKVDHAYERLLKPRKLFVDDQPEEAAADNTSTDTALDGSIKTYIDSRSDIEHDVAAAEREMIANAEKRCKGKIDPILPCDDGPFSLVSIKTPLTPIQFATLGWMIGREAPNTGGRGGIVAHDMGLGKTLMALSLMAINSTGLDKQRNPDECSTLVVVPNDAIITHWQNECARHAPDLFPAESMARYRRLKNADDVQALKPFKIVFATYGELCREVPDWYKEPKNSEEASDRERLAEDKEHPWSPIFDAKWFRVILDEAHSIKNKGSKTSLSIRRLQKKRAWAITGTPLSNNHEEMYPYFNFLGMDNSNDSPTFETKYFPKGLAGPNFRAALTKVMIRKQIRETFLGQSLIPLPAHHPTTKILLPTSKERVILSYIESQIRATAKSAYDEAINSEKNEVEARMEAYYSVVTLLHLYRYASVHPFMLENAFMTEFSVEDVEKLIAELERAENDAEESGKAKHPDFMAIEDILRVAIQDRNLGDAKCPKCGVPCAENEKTIYELPCGHFMCFDCLPWTKKPTSMKCRTKGCKTLFRNPTDTECYLTLQNPKSPEDMDPNDYDTSNESDEASPPPEEKLCKKGHGKGKPGKKGRRQRKPETKPKAKRKPPPGCDVHGNEPALDFDKKRFITCADTFLKKSRMIVPSAKLLYVQELFQEWQQIAPDDKIIVFTQFMAIARLVGRVAYLENMKFLYYTVLITSLMCRSQGLDITRANRVILMEPWWNSPAEKQAFAKVYRMGQKKEVYVVRLRCSGTREDAMAQMQLMKEEELSDCLMSRKATKSGRSFHSIMALMGLPITDGTGAVTGFKKAVEDDDFIVSDDEILAEEDGSVSEDEGFAVETDDTTTEDDDSADEGDGGEGEGGMEKKEERDRGVGKEAGAKTNGGAKRDIDGDVDDLQTNEGDAKVNVKPVDDQAESIVIDAGDVEEAGKGTEEMAGVDAGGIERVVEMTAEKASVDAGSLGRAIEAIEEKTQEVEGKIDDVAGEEDQDMRRRTEGPDKEAEGIEERVGEIKEEDQVTTGGGEVIKTEEEGDEEDGQEAKGKAEVVEKQEEVDQEDGEGTDTRAESTSQDCDQDGDVTMTG